MNKEAVKGIRFQISKLRQKRGMLEVKCERCGRMIAGYLIFRKRLTDGGFESACGEGERVFGYLSYLKGGVGRHKYVRKGRLGEVLKLTGRYREFSRSLKEIRRLNQKIVNLLDKIKTIQSEEVEIYVQERNKRNKPKARTK